MLGVLVEQLVQDSSCIWREAIEEVLPVLAESIGALSTCAEGSVVGDVAQEIERVRVRLARCRSKLVEIDPSLCEARDDLGSLVWLRPVGS